MIKLTITYYLFYDENVDGNYIPGFESLVDTHINSNLFFLRVANYQKLRTCDFASCQIVYSIDYNDFKDDISIESRCFIFDVGSGIVGLSEYIYKLKSLQQGKENK